VECIGHRKLCLTNTYIVWSNPVYEGIMIIYRCGNFPNVPLIGTKGGINYHPELARRQMGYPMRDVPVNFHLEGLFFIKGENDKIIREDIAHAWKHVHRKGKESLGKPNCISLDPYLQWVQNRAIKLRMPYPPQGVFPIRETALYFMNDVEKLQIAFNTVQRERNSWKNKYQILNTTNSMMQSLLKDKDELIMILEYHATKEEESLPVYGNAGTSNTWKRAEDSAGGGEAPPKKQKNDGQRNALIHRDLGF